MRNWWKLLAILAGATMLAILATTPPAPLDAKISDRWFSAGRAMADIRAISAEPRPTGSAANAKVRAYLIARLRSMGMEVTTAQGTMDAAGAKRLASWSKSDVTPPLTNIIAVLPGRDRSKPAVLMMAHHDSVWGSPGAADDAVGVAVILETVRGMESYEGRERDLMVVITDGEELGLQGAKSFFATDPRRAHVGVIVNLETRGGGGRATMFETGDRNGAMMGLFKSYVNRPVATSLSTFIYKTLPNSTDYTVAKKLGVPGFNYAFIGRPELYHSPMATPDRLDQGALQDMGQQVLDLTRGLLWAEDLPGKAPDRTFFDAFGLFLVIYPAGTGWLILALGVAGYAAAAWRRTTVREVAKGAGALLGQVLVAMACLYIVNVISGGWGKVNYYDRLAAIPRLQVQALLVCLATFLTVRRWLPSSIGAIAGSAAALLLVGLVMQIWAPTAAYPFAVPLMLGGLALAVDRLNKPAGLVAMIVAGVLGVGYMLGFGFFLMQAVGPKMPMIAAVPLAISTVLLLPLVPEIRPRRAMMAAIALLVAATGIALWVLLDPIAPSAATYADLK